MTVPQASKLDVVRGLGLVAAASMVVGHMIGQGIFLKTRVITCNVETPGMVIAVWVVSGFLALAGALTFAELGTMMPRSGGIYVFLREAFGPAVGFLYGWMNFVIASVGSTALGFAFAIFLNVIAGQALSVELFAWNVAGLHLAATGTQAVAVGIIFLVMLLNCAAVSLGGAIATYLTTFKIVLVAGVGLGSFLFASGDWANFSGHAAGSCEGVVDSARGGFSGFAAAMLGALLAYNGWHAIVMVAGEVKEPHRNIPRSIIGGTLAVIGLYVFINVAYFYVLTPTEIADLSANSSVATATAAKFLGVLASKLMAAALLVSTLGTLQIASMAISRSIFAMSRDGLLVRPLGEVSERTRVPVNAVVAQAAWAMIFVFFGTYDTLTDYYVFAMWIFFALTVASLFVFRRKKPEVERPYRTFGYPIVPALFLLVAGWMLANYVLTKPTHAILALALIALGLPIYWYRKMGRKTNLAP
jgi:basic amino acid/polyamine antiporter, APA family